MNQNIITLFKNNITTISNGCDNKTEGGVYLLMKASYMTAQGLNITEEEVIRVIPLERMKQILFGIYA